jgi:hypothetical protein
VCHALSLTARSLLASSPQLFPFVTVAIALSPFCCPDTFHSSKKSIFLATMADDHSPVDVEKEKREIPALRPGSQARKDSSALEVPSAHKHTRRCSSNPLAAAEEVVHRHDILLAPNLCDFDFHDVCLGRISDSSAIPGKYSGPHARPVDVHCGQCCGTCLSWSSSRHWGQEMGLRSPLGRTRSG